MDDLDWKIIRILQRDARLPFTQIARELNQPDTTVHFRTRRLLKSGIVSRFSALLNPRALGLNAAGLVRIKVGGHILPSISSNRTQTLAEELSTEDAFQWIGVSSEPMTLYALIVAPDEAGVEKTVESLRKRPDIVEVSLTPLSSIVKGWEIAGPPPSGSDRQ